MRKFEKFVNAPGSTQRKFNTVVGGVQELNTFMGDGLIIAQRTAHGYTLSLNMPVLLSRIPKHCGASVGGTAALQEVEIMHEPDSGDTFYRIKTDAWADDWNTGILYEGPDKPEWVSGTSYGVAAENSNANKVKRTAGENVTYWKCITANSDAVWTPEKWEQIYVSRVTWEDREWDCVISHLSSNAYKPGLTAHWKLFDNTKAYAFGAVGCLSTCSPQYARGAKVPAYTGGDGKIYLLATFTQVGINVGTDQNPVWIFGSLGWMKKALKPGTTIFGRLAALFRDPQT
jgi:hypothetical protein